jgi:hypothetical protein
MVEEARLITFDEARQLVMDQLGHRYPVDADFTTAPWGYQTADSYIVSAGPYAFVHRPRNEDEYKWLIPADQPPTYVNKVTGAITFPVEPNDVTTPCGAPNPDEE